MDGQSLKPDKIKQEQLKELFPEVFSEGKIDWEKLKATLGEDITFSNDQLKINTVLQMKDAGVEFKTI